MRVCLFFYESTQCLCVYDTKFMICIRCKCVCAQHKWLMKKVFRFSFLLFRNKNIWFPYFPLDIFSDWISPVKLIWFGREKKGAFTFLHIGILLSSVCLCFIFWLQNVTESGKKQTNNFGAAKRFTRANDIF